MTRSPKRSVGRPSKNSLPIFSERFQAKYLNTKKKKESRKCKLDPKNLFQTVVQLVGGANQEGYDHAILKAFRESYPISEMPGRSALCEARKKVSYHFFEDTFDEMIERFEPFRETFRGLRIYGIDGQQQIMPRTKDLVEAGFTGRAIGKYSESYMPRGYLTHAYDVLSRVTKDLRFGPVLNENLDAKEMIKKFEQNSLTLYDRLYFHPAVAVAHHQLQNYFLARCRSNACKEVTKFYQSAGRKKRTVFIAGVVVHLIKIWSPKEKEWDVYATNLPQSWLKPKFIRKLYRLRWECETSFLELTSITKIEQWHSKFLNGILQELYALFWIINYTKIQIYFRSKRTKNPLQDTYKRPNFKLIFNHVLLSFHKIFKRIKSVFSDISELIKRSTVKRKHYSRSYPRQIRSPASPYSYNNTVWYWDLKFTN
jgi:hypothetical protein